MNVLHTHSQRASERARDCINSIGLRWCLFCELKWNRHRNIVCLWDTNICTYFRFHEFHQLFGIRSMCNVPDVYVHIITTYIAKSRIYIIFYCIVKSIPLLPFYERYHARHLSQYSSQNANANMIYILVLSKLCIQVDEVVLFVYWNGKYVCFAWKWDRTRERVEENPPHSLCSFGIPWFHSKVSAHWMNKMKCTNYYCIIDFLPQSFRI